MSYKNGINGYRALLIKSSNVDYIDEKRISLNIRMSKTFLKNKYKYIRYQGNYYSFFTKRAWANAPLKVWLGKKVNVLLLSKKELVSIKEYYLEKNETQKKFKPDFSSAPINYKTKKILEELSEINILPFVDYSYKMSDLINLFLQEWENLNNSNK